jgi:hypothetical protein
MRLLALLIFCFWSCILNAQWRQLQDSLLMQGAFTSICSIHGKWIAGTKSGLYISENADFKWKHLSSLHYYEVKQVFAIDSFLFVRHSLPDGDQLWRSNDLGVHWTTVMKNIPNPVNFLTVGKNIFVYNSEVQVSSDYGSSWSEVPYDLEVKYNEGYYNSNSNGIIGLLDDNPNKASLSFSGDGLHFKKMFDTTGNYGAFPFFTRVGTSVYIIKSPDILSYDTLTGQLTHVGYTPDSFQQSQYFSQLSYFVKAGGKWFMVCNVSGRDTNYFYIYASNDLKKWNQIASFPRATINKVHIQCPDEKALVISNDSTDFVVDSAGASFRPEYGIPPANIQLTRFRNILMAKNAGIGQPVMIWSRREIGLLANRNDSARLLNAINYMQPVAKGTGNLVYSPHHVLTVDTGGSLYMSADSGRSWEDITYGFDFKENRPDLITEYRNSFLTLAFNKTQSHHFTYYLDPEKRQWKMVALVEFAQRTDLFTVAGGTAVGAFPGFESDLFTLDWGGGAWRKAPATGLPDGMYRFIPAGNNILAFEGSLGLYISPDAAQTFSRDTTLPEGVNLHFQFVNTGQSSNFGWIDSALFISTNAGVWYNTGVYYPYTDEFKLDPYHFEVFPNPATDHFNIRYTSDNSQVCYLSIMDMSGKQCKTYQLEPVNGDAQFLFSREGLRKGVYILQLRTGSSIQTRKLVLE